MVPEWLPEILWRVRGRGLAGTLLSGGRALPRLLARALYLRREAYITCVDVGGIPPPQAAFDVKVFGADAKDLQRLDGLLSPARRRVLQRRVEAGQVLLVAEMGGEVAGYCFLAFAPTYAREADRRIAVGPGEAYGHGAFTFEPYRRRGVYTALLANSLRVARQRGIRCIHGAVAINNPAARAAVRRMGARAVSAAGSVRILGVKRRWQRALRETEQL